MPIDPEILKGKQPNAHQSVVVAQLPLCDICKLNEMTDPDTDQTTLALYDACLDDGFRTSWAYVCQRHFEIYRCKMGPGRGQKLEVANPPETVVKS